MTEHSDAEIRLRRLRMRSWHRGTKEMDIVLGHYADERLAIMDDADLALYDALLDENDQDLYRWVSGQAAAPDRFAGLVGRIADHALARLRPAETGRT
ncbi:TPR repeat family protein [Oceaniovalibus guishaninsula JLT2003]|uniref:FAD assembly factor SdhE n=1 Tax=Oceaniovalibus guishaninsula JLT2003 TaxID=1231392 RepID=K2HE78_9RHOB|nr:succinate dehydrogenase assembly factor 2 [Oceaniovalibus guishaninsula]EKE45768.1 TPR repeat family protein [Oceaniovalibus guishaninsula JLT2003]